MRSNLVWCNNCALIRAYQESTEENKSNISARCPICILCNYIPPKGGCHSVTIVK